jgi:hypothetical protein
MTPRFAIVVCGGLCALAALLALHRATQVRIEYYDGHAYLNNAHRMAGNKSLSFDRTRPPLTSLLQVPAALLAKAGPPAGVRHALGPHLTATLVALASALAVFFLLRQGGFPGPLALVGLLFLLWGRLFVRYASLTMADLPSVGAVALALGLYLRAVQHRRLTDYLWCGLAVGLAGACKFPLLVLGAVPVATELMLLIRQRAWSGRRLVSLVLLCLAAGVSFVAVAGLCFKLAFGSPLPPAIRSLWGHFDVLVPAAMAGESRVDLLVMLPEAAAWPVLALGLVGLALAVRRPRDTDLAMLAALVILGLAFGKSMAHNETRYLYPLLPVLLYFAVRGLAWMVDRLPAAHERGLLMVSVSLMSLWGGLQQAWADADPVFFADTQRKSLLALLEARKPGGRLLWLRDFTCLYPQRRLPMPHDEYFDSFHANRNSLGHLLAEPLLPLATFRDARDGDAALEPGPLCYSLTLPSTPAAPWRVSAVRRRPLTWSDSKELVSHDRSVVLRPGSPKADLTLTVVKATAGIRYMVFIKDKNLRTAGPTALTVGQTLSFGAGDKTIASAELLELSDRLIPAR